MRRFLPVLLLPLSACGGGSLTVEGSLADSTAATELWALGRPERVPVENGVFRLSDVEGDTVELRFVTGRDEHARMLLHDLPRGGTLRLQGVWFADGVAFPASVAGADPPITANGLRMGSADAIPTDVNLPGTVLAVADDGDALMVRPTDASIPDLNVLITPASIVRTIDGDVVEAEQLEFGDTLRVSGIGEGGHVIAAEILVSRRVAANDEDQGSSGSVDPASERGRTPATVVSRGSGAREIAVERPEARRTGEEAERGNRKGQGEERGKGKGKGKGRE